MFDHSPDSPKTPPRIHQLQPDENPFLNIHVMSGINGPLMDIREAYFNMLISWCQKNLIPLENSQNRKRDIGQLLDGSFCVGELHHENTPKKFLIQNMELLAQKGFKILFLEHLFAEEHQSLLDDYSRSPLESEVPEELAIRLTEMNKGHFAVSGISEFNFITLIKAAKKCQIKIVAIDNKVISKTYKPGINGELDPYSSYLRTLLMNGFAKTIMDLPENQSQKWFALVGNAHVNTRNFDGRQPVPGIADVTGCQDLLIFNEKITKLISTKEKQLVIVGGNTAESKLSASLMIEACPSDNLQLQNFLKKTKKKYESGSDSDSDRSVISKFSDPETSNPPSNPRRPKKQKLAESSNGRDIT